MSAIVSTLSCSAEKLNQLRCRLDEYYRTTTDYPAFQEIQDQSRWFSLLFPILEEKIKQKGTVRVLEMGAGKSGFAQLITKIRKNISYHVQDVTPVNKEYLSSVADMVHIGDISEIQDQYDMIFFYFCYGACGGTSRISAGSG